MANMSIEHCCIPLSLLSSQTYTLNMDMDVATTTMTSNSVRLTHDANYSVIDVNVSSRSDNTANIVVGELNIKF